MVDYFVLPDPTPTRRTFRCIRGLAVFGVVVEAGLGAILILWEVIQGPTVDAGGYTQDGGGYVLGIPLAGAGLVAGVLLALARTHREDRMARTSLEAIALCTVAAPLLLATWATAGGFLDVTLLWSDQ